MSGPKGCQGPVRSRRPGCLSPKPGSVKTKEALARPSQPLNVLVSSCIWFTLHITAYHRSSLHFLVPPGVLEHQTAEIGMQIPPEMEANQGSQRGTESQILTSSYSLCNVPCQGGELGTSWKEQGCVRDRCRVDLGSNNSEALPRASPGSQGLDRNFRACLGPPAMCFLCVVRGYIHHSIIKKSKAEKKSGSRKQDDIARTQTNNKTRKRERGGDGGRMGVLERCWKEAIIKTAGDSRACKGLVS